VKVLLVCAAPVLGTSALLPRLAAAADLVVAVDGGGSVCLEAGVLPDIVLGDFDSLSSADLDRLREMGASILKFPAEKDASDLELAVAEVRGRGATSLVLTAATSGRLDHAVAVLGVMSAARDLSPTIVEPELEVWALSPEGRVSLDLSGAGATISLLPLGGPAVVSVSGVVWELDEVELDPTSSRGLSNRIAGDGLARVGVSRGLLLVFAPHLEGSARAQGS
jgi:thiamine pyrophosphokinase